MSDSMLAHDTPVILKICVGWGNFCSLERKLVWWPGNYNYVNLILRTWFFCCCCFFFFFFFFLGGGGGQKICKMLKTSMWDYEKSSVVTYPFHFINWQSINKTSCMQIMKKILMWEVLPAIALKSIYITWRENNNTPFYKIFKKTQIRTTPYILFQFVWDNQSEYNGRFVGF